MNREEQQQALELAVRHHGAGELSEAEALYQEILKADPKQPVALHLLGVIAHQTGNSANAVELIAQALSLEPDYAEAHNNLGNALRDLGRGEDAAASYHKALAVRPDYAEAHNNLSIALLDLGRGEDALASCQKALAIEPDFPEAHNNLGLALQGLDRLEDAAVSYHKALAVKPEYAEAHNNLGNTLKNLGRVEEAVASYNKALAVRPDYVKAGRNLLFALLNVPGLSPDELFSEHLRFSEKHSQGIARPAEDLTNDPTPERRLRVGYLSSDFRNQSTGSVLLPLLSSHDKEQFEVFCYADVLRPDAMTERFRSTADHWRAITGKSDSEVAGMVRADAIDVLVCPAGRFGRNRPLVCAYRAVPVQVSFHDGATSGLEDMDYWLTDDYLHPAGTKEKFTEELYRLPVFYQWPVFEESPSVAALPADRAGFVTFGSFNNPAKINEEVSKLLYRSVFTPKNLLDIVARQSDQFDADELLGERHRIERKLEATLEQTTRADEAFLRKSWTEKRYDDQVERIDREREHLREQMARIDDQLSTCHYTDEIRENFALVFTYLSDLRVLLSQETPVLLAGRKEYDAEEIRAFHLKRELIRACTDRIYVDPDGGVQFDIHINAANLSVMYSHFVGTFEENLGVIACINA